MLTKTNFLWRGQFAYNRLDKLNDIQGKIQTKVYHITS